MTTYFSLPAVVLVYACWLNIIINNNSLHFENVPVRMINYMITPRTKYIVTGVCAWNQSFRCFNVICFISLSSEKNSINLN